MSLGKIIGNLFFWGAVPIYIGSTIGTIKTSSEYEYISTDLQNLYKIESRLRDIDLEQERKLTVNLEQLADSTFNFDERFYQQKIESIKLQNEEDPLRIKYEGLMKNKQITDERFKRERLKEYNLLFLKLNLYTMLPSTIGIVYKIIGISKRKKKTEEEKEISQEISQEKDEQTK